MDSFTSGTLAASASGTASAVQQTYYQPQPEEDDRTFVDRGSTTQSILPSGMPSGQNQLGFGMAPGAVEQVSSGHRTFPSLTPAVSQASAPTRGGKGEGPSSLLRPDVNSSPEEVMPTPSVLLGSTVDRNLQGYPEGGLNLLGTNSQTNRSFNELAHSSEILGSTPKNEQDGSSSVWNPPRVVSQMRMDNRVRTMAVGPDGKSLWIAIGDDPLTLLEVQETNLVVSRSIENIAQVYCLAVVRIPGMARTKFQSMPDSDNRGGEVKTEDQCFLWCGLNKGHIQIYDLQQYVDGGFIPTAHSTTVHRIWPLPNGTVWTSGLDKALKVWDPQTRRKKKNRNIAVILEDLCYVKANQTVWGIATDNAIRVFEGSGDNVHVKQTGDNVLKMKNELILIQYCDDADLVWAGSTKSTALIDPTSFKIVSNLKIVLSSVAFNHKTAIVTGHGELVESTVDCVAVLDITNPQDTTPLFIGSTMEGVTPIGMQLFWATPLAVVAQDDGRYQKKSLTVFTYEETVPLGKYSSNWGDVPQRRVGENFRGVLPPSNASRQPYSLGWDSSRDGQRNEATSLRGAIQDGSAGREPLTTDVLGGVPLTRSQAALAASPAMLGLLENIADNSKETRRILSMMSRTQEPVTDLSRLQTSIVQWLSTITADVLPPLSPGEVEAIEADYRSPEAKFLATTFARLQGALASSSQKGAFQGTSEGASSPIYLTSSLTERMVDATTKLIVNGDLQSGKPRSNVASRGAEEFSGIPLNLAHSSVINQLASAISTRIGSLHDLDRFRHQIELIQRYNKRLQDRQTAMILGITRIDQVMRSTASELIATNEELGHLNTASSAESLMELLERMPTISPSSSVSDLEFFFSTATSVLMKIVQIQKQQGSNYLKADKVHPLVHSTSMPSQTAEPFSPPWFASEEADSLYHLNFKPGEPSRLCIDFLVISPKQILFRIDEECARLRSFLSEVTIIYKRRRNLRELTEYSSPERISTTPEGKVKDAYSIADADLKEVKLLLDICSVEGFLWAMECLLDNPEAALNHSRGTASGVLHQLIEADGKAEAVLDKVMEERCRVVDLSLTVEKLGTEMRHALEQTVINSLESKKDTSHLSDRPPLSVGLQTMKSSLPFKKHRYTGVLYWADVCLVLLTQCLELIELQLYPLPGSTSELSTDDFSFIVNQLYEWEVFILDVGDQCSDLHFVGSICTLEAHALTQHPQTKTSSPESLTNKRPKSNGKKSDEIPPKDDDVLKKQAGLRKLGRFDAPKGQGERSGMFSEGDSEEKGQNFAKGEAQDPSLRLTALLLFLRCSVSVALQTGESSSIFQEFAGEVHIATKLIAKCKLLAGCLNLFKERTQLIASGAQFSDGTIVIDSDYTDEKANAPGDSGSMNRFPLQDRIFCRTLLTSDMSS